MKISAWVNGKIYAPIVARRPRKTLVFNGRKLKLVKVMKRKTKVTAYYE